MNGSRTNRALEAGATCGSTSLAGMVRYCYAKSQSLVPATLGVGLETECTEARETLPRGTASPAPQTPLPPKRQRRPHGVTTTSGIQPGAGRCYPTCATYKTSRLLHPHHLHLRPRPPARRRTPRRIRHRALHPPANLRTHRLQFKRIATAIPKCPASSACVSNTRHPSSMATIIRLASWDTFRTSMDTTA